MFAKGNKGRFGFMVGGRIVFLGALVMVAVVITASEARAECYIDDVIDLVDDGLSRSKIRRECDNEIIDAAGCSLSQVIRYAKRYDYDEILDRCERKSRAGNPGRGMSNLCASQAGPCRLFGSAPRGTPCWCNTPYGPAPGRIR